MAIIMQSGKRLMIDEIDAGIHYSRFKIFWKTIIKAAKANNVKESGKVIKDNAAVRYQKIEQGYAIYSVGSGNYSFNSQPGN